MKLKRVYFSLFFIGCFLLLQVFGIANRNENVIGEEDRRGSAKPRFYNSFENYKRHPYPEYEAETLSSPSGYSYQHHSSSYGDHYPHHSGDGYPSAPSNYYHQSHQGHNPLALKSLLIPLAGIALLGAAAAALTTNPVLLQLGVVNGRRKKRSLSYPPTNPTYMQHKYHKR